MYTFVNVQVEDTNVLMSFLRMNKVIITFHLTSCYQCIRSLFRCFVPSRTRDNRLWCRRSCLVSRPPCYLPEATDDIRACFISVHSHISPALYIIIWPLPYSVEYLTALNTQEAGSYQKLLFTIRILLKSKSSIVAITDFAIASLSNKHIVIADQMGCTGHLITGHNKGWYSCECTGITGSNMYSL